MKSARFAWLGQMRPWFTLLSWFVSCLVSQAAASNSSEARFRPIPISSHMRLCSVPPLSSPRLAMAGILEREGRVDAAHRDSRSAESHEVPGREDSSTDWFQHAGYGVFPLEFTKSIQAQFVRVSALKPDGPDQKGAQMAVAELEVYE